MFESVVISCQVQPSSVYFSSLFLMFSNDFAHAPICSYSKGVSSAARRIRKVLGAAEVEDLTDAITLAASSVCNDVVLVLVKSSEKKKVSVDVRAGDPAMARALCEAAIAALTS